jgi:uncharacterized protein YjlB
MASDGDLGSVQTTVRVVAGSDGFPNNDLLPLVALRGALPQGLGQPEAFEQRFADHGWGGSWRDGVFGVHHYHSTAHEVLGVYGGTATVQFGGPRGVVLAVAAGDVVVIPAGVAHKRLASSPDFAVVGAYPEGQHPDLCYGRAGELPAACARIAALPVPAADPVFGAAGPLLRHWPGPGAALGSGPVATPVLHRA